MPTTAELSSAEMEWFLASANELQGLSSGRTGEPNFCSVSGPNHYCQDNYELASALHYQVEKMDEHDITQEVLRDIRGPVQAWVSGIVEDVRVQCSRPQIKVMEQWYQGEKAGMDTFEQARIGPVVRLITFGCATYEKVCRAEPEQ